MLRERRVDVLKLISHSLRIDNSRWRNKRDFWHATNDESVGFFFSRLKSSHTSDTRSLFTRSQVEKGETARREKYKSSTYLTNKYLANSQLVILDTPPEKVTRYLLFPVRRPEMFTAVRSLCSTRYTSGPERHTRLSPPSYLCSFFMSYG